MRRSRSVLSDQPRKVPRHETESVPEDKDVKTERSIFKNPYPIAIQPVLAGEWQDPSLPIYSCKILDKVTMVSKIYRFKIDKIKNYEMAVKCEACSTIRHPRGPCHKCNYCKFIGFQIVIGSSLEKKQLDLVQMLPGTTDPSPITIEEAQKCYDGTTVCRGCEYLQTHCHNCFIKPSILGSEYCDNCNDSFCIICWDETRAPCPCGRFLDDSLPICLACRSLRHPKCAKRLYTCFLCDKIDVSNALRKHKESCRKCDPHIGKLTLLGGQPGYDPLIFKYICGDCVDWTCTDCKIFKIDCLGCGMPYIAPVDCKKCNDNYSLRAKVKDLMREYDQSANVINESDQDDTVRRNFQMARKAIPLLRHTKALPIGGKKILLDLYKDEKEFRKEKKPPTKCFYCYEWLCEKCQNLNKRKCKECNVLYELPKDDCKNCVDNLLLLSHIYYNIRDIREIMEQIKMGMPVPLAKIRRFTRKALLLVVPQIVKNSGLPVIAVRILEFILENQILI